MKGTFELRTTDIDPIFSKLYETYYSPADFEWIKTAASANGSDLGILQVFYDSILLGYLVVRSDVLFDRTKELAVIRALATVKGKNPIAHVISHGISEYAKRMGFDSIRIHSDHKGLDIFLEEAGFKFQESVFTKRLKNA